MALSINKSAAYDDAMYRARQKLALAASAAGSGGTFGRYVAAGNEVLYGGGAWQTTAGTSTYTTTDTTTAGTATNTTTAATLVQVFRVSGTSTTTGNTFVIGAGRTANWTNPTNASGSTGISLSLGDIIYMVNGTDATAVSVPYWEIGLQGGAQ